jgi:phage terminase Nu1 subunit (DNA packaging protein)
MRERVSARELGRRCGVSLSSIQKAVASGRVSPPDRLEGDRHPMYWWPDAQEEYEASREPTSVEVPAEEMIDFYVERARKTRAEADLKELELAQMRGALHHGEDVAAVQNHMVASFRVRMLSIPTTCAGLVQGKADLAEIEAILRRAVHEGLAELATYDPTQYIEEAKRHGRRVAGPVADDRA